MFTTTASSGEFAGDWDNNLKDSVLDNSRQKREFSDSTS